MLILEPPFTSAQWERRDPTSPQFRKRFASYCHDYSRAVLALPPAQLDELLESMGESIATAEADPAAFAEVLRRELDNPAEDVTRRAACLIVLAALADSFRDAGVHLGDDVTRLAQRCREQIPEVLEDAVAAQFSLSQSPG